MKPSIGTKKLAIMRLGPATLFTFLTLALAAIPLAAETNWAQTYHDSAHTGYNSQETTLGTGNVASLQLLWATGVAGGVTNFAVDNGVVFATGQSNNLVALNASTGAQLWNANTGGNPGDRPVATGNGLVFTQCSLPNNAGGAICAYKQSTGKMAWHWASPCNCLPPSSVSAPLVYADGVVYFGYSSGGTTSTTGLYAVEASTGKLLWTSLSEFNNGWGVSGAAISGSNVYLEANNYGTGAIYSLASPTGDQNWTTPVSLGNSNSAVSVAGGVVYTSGVWTGTNATLYAMNATTGALLWSYVYATENWCGSEGFPSPPAIAKGVVYFQGVDGNLYALKANKGTLLWADTPNSQPCTGTFNSSPSLANGVLYINGGPDGPNTSAYNAATGAELWSSPSSHGTLQMPPVVVNGILYIASPGDTICESICAYSVPANE
ncbi:MAG: PQQ-binding-like beta-propeller repeat protein [Candidatus Sulfotelmatobacter sp.]|jgi:outer membrane protein assembly factor BamB